MKKVAVYAILQEKQGTKGRRTHLFILASMPATKKKTTKAKKTTSPKKAKAKAKAPKAKAPKSIGEITHYYGGIGVAIVKFSKSVSKGDMARFKGAHTDFTQTISSMQYNHKDIESAKKGQEIGIKVDDKVREGDKVFEPEK